MSTSRSRPAPKKGRSSTPLIIGAIGLVVIVAAVVAVVVNSGGDSSDDDVTAVVAAATSVPAAVADEVGMGVANAVPQAVDGDALTSDGKPQVLYVGAEYCPFCAAERWPLVVALSRFGTFSGLGLTTSASQDVFPSTATFTFHGATYTSDYLTFSPFELYTNQPTGQGGYEPLDTLPADLQAAWQKIDPNLSFPFIDLGGKYVVAGATYDVSIVNGRTATQIADSLTDATKGVTRAIVGTANTLTAAICQLTGQQPADVCTAKAVTAIEL